MGWLGVGGWELGADKTFGGFLARFELLHIRFRGSLCSSSVKPAGTTGASTLQQQKQRKTRGYHAVLVIALAVKMSLQPFQCRLSNL